MMGEHCKLITSISVRLVTLAPLTDSEQLAKCRLKKHTMRWIKTAYLPGPECCDPWFRDKSLVGIQVLGSALLNIFTDNHEYIFQQVHSIQLEGLADL